VVNPDHTVSMRMVELGQTEGDKQAVTKGLMVGETVVTDGADRLRDNARVVLPGEQPPAVATDQTRGPGNRGGRQGGQRGGGGGRGPGGGG
jgi:multidrug efflux system membrane fusion protein